MPASFSLILIFLICVFSSLLIQGARNVYLGCYKKEKIDEDTAFLQAGNLDLWFKPNNVQVNNLLLEDCIDLCSKNYFKFAGVYKINNKLDCSCGSNYGRNGLGQCELCKEREISRPLIGSSSENLELLCGSEDSFSVYNTEFKVSSPPQQIILVSSTENSLRISWIKPLSPNGAIVGFLIVATPIFTYSLSQLQPISIKTNDDVDQTNILGLTPGSQYNVSVSAINSDGKGFPASVVLWTKVGQPDTPSSPRILREDSNGGTMLVSLQRTRNTKGPISGYQLLLVDDGQYPVFNKDQLFTWNDTVNFGSPYYVAAEFLTDEFPRQFLFGDRHFYGRFYNGPIPNSGHWHPKLGIVSSMDGFVQLSFSETSHDQHPEIIPVRKVKEREERVEVIESNSTVIKALWIAIGISTIILLACVAIYLVLKMNLLPKRRRQSAPALSLQESSNNSNKTINENRQTGLRDTSLITLQTQDPSTVGYTHAAFVGDEDMRSIVLAKLKEVWYVPRNFIDIPNFEEDIAIETVGKGNYGPIYKSFLKTNNTPVTLYSLSSKIFKSDSILLEDQHQLFSDLDSLIKIGSHDNIVKLIGFMEDQEAMYFIVENGDISLKHWLLNQRSSLLANDKSSLNSYNLLLCAMNIAEGMFHLHSFKINHGKLAAINISITKVERPKITGFGFLTSNPTDSNRDYTRWSAQEQFQNRCVKPCDVWGFAVLLWEIASLGATPYYDIRSEDLQKRICYGTRPNQLEVISDSLYQIMLHCWQLDRDERPDFCSLSCSIHELLPQNRENLFISSSYKYPPYMSNYEYIP